ncbi:cupin domain-containing protein [Metallumcola ferriviriculae]|uniref:Cupin domain-containing protein n=1 Tax=Metallumcola ferriviriculae TaxID=3039180 RepID=A0AAU0UTE3_9FIRM|nr:cupin domain-containing protein [Desulfitibacteraceae bacterium MK1]
MYVSNVKDIKSTTVNAPGVKNALKQVLIGPEQGWEGWVMRHFTLGASGNSPKHSHPWPHINYIVSGEGILFLDGNEHNLGPGSVAYVPGGTEHQFRNNGTADFAFICIVPEEGDV